MNIINKKYINKKKLSSSLPLNFISNIKLIQKKLKIFKLVYYFLFIFFKINLFKQIFSCLSLLIFFSDNKDCLWGLIFILDGILCLFISWLFTDIFKLENVVFFCHQLIFLINFFFINNIFFLSFLKGFYLFHDLNRLLILHVT